MAEEALSKSAIDALLAQTQSASKKNLEGASPITDTAVHPYDFRKQKKFNKGQFVFLESIHRRFLRNFEVTLTNLLNSPVMATLAAATELTYHDCSASFASPTCLYSLNVNDGSSKFLLEIDPNLSFFIIDKILGGKGDGRTEVERELSLIEERIVGRVVKLLLHDLQDAWGKIEAFHLEVDGFYAQPDYVQVFAPTDSVIFVSIDVRNAERVLGYLNLCLPCTALEQLVQSYEKSSNQVELLERQNSNSRKNIEARVRKAVLPLRAILGKTSMQAREISNLKPGDILFLNSDATKPIDILVGDLRLYRGLAIQNENSVLVKIDQIVKQAPRVALAERIS